jgi:hypothetical protein
MLEVVHRVVDKVPAEEGELTTQGSDAATVSSKEEEAWSEIDLTGLDVKLTQVNAILDEKEECEAATNFSNEASSDIDIADLDAKLSDLNEKLEEIDTKIGETLKRTGLTARSERKYVDNQEGVPSKETKQDVARDRKGSGVFCEFTVQDGSSVVYKLLKD